MSLLCRSKLNLLLTFKKIFFFVSHSNYTISWRRLSVCRCLRSKQKVCQLVDCFHFYPISLPNHQIFILEIFALAIEIFSNFIIRDILTKCSMV